MVGGTFGSRLQCPRRLCYQPCWIRDGLRTEYRGPHHLARRLDIQGAAEALKQVGAGGPVSRPIAGRQLGQGVIVPHARLIGAEIAIGGEVGGGERPLPQLRVR